MALCFETRIKHKNTLSVKKVEFLNFKLVVHKVNTWFEKVKSITFRFSPCIITVNHFY